MRNCQTALAHAFSACAVSALFCLATSAASAQGLQSLFPWEWKLDGFTETSGNAGRQTISFPHQITPGQIIVSFTDRRLYYVAARGTAIAYPIATPRRQDRWQGTLRVSQKRVNPPWTPTPDMLRENPSLPAHVPGGDPRNPLGSHALYLGTTLYRIHGTDAPWTIGQPVSKGCVRMHNADVRDLYGRVGVGTAVTITWQSFYAS
ncbi:MAG: L,D-transpeptidase [Alphaproteobacteria bacterium]|nr:L,D-transpeptidase [Alphaproteobacteria bacterium]